MAMAAEEIIGVAQAQSKPGIPYGSVVTLPKVGGTATEGYASYEALAAEVAARMDEWYGSDPSHPVELRRIYRNPNGTWVRVVGEHTGETHTEKDAQGRVIATWAARVWKERAVALTKDQATGATDTPMDWFHPRYGWLRNGVKREREDELNVGTRARQKVQWEAIANASPSPSDGMPSVNQLPASTPLVPSQITQAEAARVDPESFSEPIPPPEPPQRKGK